MTDYVEGQDELIVMGNDYEQNIIGAFNYTTGVLTFTHNGIENLGPTAWSAVLNNVAYKLIAEEGTPENCFIYTNIRKTFSMQVIDRGLRLSNILTRDMAVKTSLVMLTTTQQRGTKVVSSVGPAAAVNLAPNYDPKAVGTEFVIVPLEGG